MWMWLTSVASTIVYKSCLSSRVSTILIIHPTYSLLPVIDVYAASHSCKLLKLLIISLYVFGKGDQQGIVFTASVI